MRNILMPVCTSLALLLATSIARSQRPSAAGPEDDSKVQWRDVVERMKWPAVDVEKLGKNKVLVNHESYKQVFEPYFGVTLPVFVTSDSLLNAYHVLYEESVLRLERAQAAKLPGLLRPVWIRLDGIDKGVTGDAVLAKNARQRAQVVIGTAMRLLSDEPLKPAPDDETAAIIAREV